MNAHRFVFVAGLHRSGTSLLHDTLRSHPQVSGFSGTGVPEDEGQHLQTIVPTAADLGGPGRFALDPSAHLTESSPLATPETASALFQQWSPHWDLNRPVLIEKSPPTLLRTRFFQALFPQSWFVIVLRHPLVVSLATRKWAYSRSYQALVEHWLRCHEIFMDDAVHLRRLLVLRYEAFCADPDALLGRVAGFLELDDQFVRPELEESTRRYEDRWTDFKRHPRGRVEARLLKARFERRCRRFGYSILDLRTSEPLIPRE